MTTSAARRRALFRNPETWPWFSPAIAILSGFSPEVCAPAITEKMVAKENRRFIISLALAIEQIDKPRRGGAVAVRPPSEASRQQQHDDERNPRGPEHARHPVVMVLFGDLRQPAGEQHLRGSFRKNVGRGHHQVHAASQDAGDQRGQDQDYDPAIVVAATPAAPTTGPPMAPPRSGRCPGG